VRLTLVAVTQLVAKITTEVQHLLGKTRKRLL